MKKILLIAICFFSFHLGSIAQSNEKPIPEMQDLTQQMEKMMEEMQRMMGNMPMMTDTFFMKGFSYPMMPGDSWGISPLDSLESGGIFDLLQEQMRQLDDQDWVEIQKLLEQFGQQIPMIPAPEDLPENGSKDPNKRKSKKKRKVYTL